MYSKGCTKLTSVNILANLTTISLCTFADCSSLKKINIPESVTNIGGGAFSGCSSLGEIIIPKGVNSIGDQTFMDCSSLTEITIPEGVTSIASFMFHGCSSLTTVNFPGGITTIESSVFSNCSIFNDIYYNNTRSKWESIHNDNYLPDTIVVHCIDDDDYETWKDKFETNEGGNESMPDTPTTPSTSEMICVSEEMLELLVTQILTKVNSRIAARIVNTISEESDANHVPSALAVFNFLRTFSPSMKYETVTGPISSVTDPAGSTIYLQRDDENDTTWAMYMWVEDEWIIIGDTTVDLTNYWSKSAADIAALRDQILDDLGLSLIKEGIDYNNLFKDNTATQQIILGWLDSGTIVRTTEEGLAALYVELDKRYVQITNLKVVTTEQIQSAVNAAYAATEPEI